MAIVFKQLKKAQKIFFWNIIAAMFLILFIVSLIVFPPGFKRGPEIIFEELTPKPDIKINFSVIDSDKVKELESFKGAQKEFNYVVKDKNGRQLRGSISAKNQSEAEATLKDSGLEVLILQEKELPGKSQPFTPYY